MRITKALASELANDFNDHRGTLSGGIAVCEEMARHDGPELTIEQGEKLYNLIKKEWDKMDEDENQEYITVEECKRDKTHLTKCDDSGYCNFCGEQ